MKTNEINDKQNNEYHANITIEFSELGEAKDEKEARFLVKESFRESYNLELEDHEIEIEMY
jgi:hypothetical protein